MRTKAAWFKTAVLSGLLAGAAPLHADLINGVAVIVNDEVITYKDVMLSIAPTVRLLQTQYGNRPDMFRQRVSEVQEEATQQLIERELILHDFDASGFVIPESVIDGLMEERIKERYGDRVRMAKTLQEEGMTVESFREKLREQVIIDALTRRNVPQAPVISPFKIEKYYLANQDKFRVEDQVKLSMIFINNVGDGNNDIARTRIEEIIQKINEGASFAEMAAVYSEGSQSTEGGDWGWVDKYNADGSPVLRKELFDVAFSLAPGQMSDVIETPTGCYLMKVEEKRASHVQPLSEVREVIEQELILAEKARLREKWIERLKAKSFIRYF
jgi:peptidyl-prolyl cis-trans isomerase SurA